MGKTGVIAAQKLAKVPEVDLDALINLIEARGTRIAWSRASSCPCRLNDETEQPDPNCTLCSGLGWFYFGPNNYKAPDDVGDLTPLQTAIQEEDGACIVRGLVQRIKSEHMPYTEMGPWRVGEMMVTVRPENKIGYYDRIILLDSVIVYDEVIEIPNGISTTMSYTMNLRYRAQAVNAIFSLTNRYEEGGDFTVNDQGVVIWDPGSAPAGERVSVHYLTHPSFLIVDRPHTARQSSTYRKPTTTRTTPLGDPQELPLQAHVMLEFLRDKRPEVTASND